MTKLPPGHLLAVGKVIRPHGLRGLMRIEAYLSSEQPFPEVGSVFLRQISGDMAEMQVISLEAHKRGFLLKLKGIESIEQAEGYRGSEILVSKGALGEKEDGEYFWDELLGLEVFLDTGESLGALSRIIPTGANDIYVVKKGDREQLIPATVEVVKEVDLESGTMIVSALKGLIDLNEV